MDEQQEPVIVDVPGVGPVSFPASMPHAQIEAAAANLIGHQQRGTLDQFWTQHPNLKQLALGTVNALPAVGAMTGGAIGAGSSVPTLGATAIPTAMAGAALGAGVGRGARDLVAEAAGLESPSGIVAKTGTIAADTALTAATPGVVEALKAPFSTAGDFLDWAKDIIPKQFQPKFIQGAAQFLKDLGSEAKVPSLSRPSGPVAEFSEASKPTQTPTASPDVPKPKLTAFDMIRVKGLMAKGMTQDQAFKTVFLAKSPGFANLPTDEAMTSAIAARGASGRWPND